MLWVQVWEPGIDKVGLAACTGGEMASREESAKGNVVRSGYLLPSHGCPRNCKRKSDCPNATEPG